MLGPLKELKVSVLERDDIGMLSFSERKGAPVSVNNFVYLGARARDVNGNEDWVDAEWVAENGDVVLITPHRCSQVRVVGLKPADHQIAIRAEYDGLTGLAFIERISQRTDRFSNSGALREQPLRL
jgi:SH3-like domain-containing protein